MSDLLTGNPGETYMVQNERPEHDENYEMATADDDGVLRDEDGKSFSEGAYSIDKIVEAHDQ